MNQYRREYVECTSEKCNKIVCRLCFASRLKDQSWEEAKLQQEYKCPQCTGTCPCERCLKSRLREQTPKAAPVKATKLEPVPTLDSLLYSFESDDITGDEPTKRIAQTSNKRKKITRTRSQEKNSYSDEDAESDDYQPNKRREESFPSKSEQIRQLNEQVLDMEQTQQIYQGTVARLAQDVAEMKRDNSMMEKKMTFMMQEIYNLRQNHSEVLGAHDLLNRSNLDFETPGSPMVFSTAMIKFLDETII